MCGGMTPQEPGAPFLVAATNLCQVNPCPSKALPAEPSPHKELSVQSELGLFLLQGCLSA